MPYMINRRDILKMAGLGGLVFASGLPGGASAAADPAMDFCFLQLSDCHWGFMGPPNPDAAVTLPRTIETINGLDLKPDFVIFTGDLTQTTDDADLRRRRMREFKEIVGKIKGTSLRFIPGEHDAAPDEGDVYRDMFGPSFYSFDHKGIHFVALDNVSDPGSRLGDRQLDWLAADLALKNRAERIVVFAHRPLFDLYPDWDWATADGARALELFARFEHVSVFYGHIHQEHHHRTGTIAHHAAKSLIFPLPAPGSAPKRQPLPWNPDQPYAGLGFRDVTAPAAMTDFRIDEYPVIRRV